MIHPIIQSYKLAAVAVLSGWHNFWACFMAEIGKLAVLEYPAINV